MTAMGGQTFFNRTVLSLAIKAGSAGLAFALAILLARVMGPAQFGIYSLAIAMVTVLASPAQLGLPQLLVRETAKGGRGEDAGGGGKHHNIRSLWGVAIKGALLTSAVVMALAFAAMTLFADRYDPAQYSTLVAALVLVPLVSLLAVEGGALRGAGRVFQGQLAELLMRPGGLILLVLLAAFAGWSLTPRNVIGLYIVSAGVALLICSLWLVRATPRGAVPEKPLRSMPVLWQAMPLGLIGAMQLLNNNTDLIMLGFLSTPEDVGIYRVVIAMVNVVAFGLQAVNMIAAPDYSHYYHKDDRAGLQNVVTRSSRATLATALPLCFVFIVFGEQLLEFAVDSRYSVGYLPLVILALGQLANVSFGHVGSLLMMTGHERYSLYVMVVVTVINIVLNALLIPRWGLVGASIATAVTMVLWNVAMWVIVLRKLGIQSCAFLARMGRSENEMSVA